MVGAGVLTFTGAAAAVAETGVLAPTNPNKLTARGPVNTETGFPSWYGDGKTRLELCLDPTNGLCGILPDMIPDNTKPASFPDNFPAENFYFLAGSSLALPGGGKATLTLGLEGSFISNKVVNGDQMVFGRQRIVVKGAPPNQVLTFTEPYGTIEIDTDATGAGKVVEDVGASVGLFDAALKSNIGPFLIATGGPVKDADGNLYVGNPDVLTTVTGGLNGNAFSVTGGGLNLSTNQFNIQGKIATNHGVQADSAVINKDGTLDVFGTSEGGAVEVVGTAGSFATTPMVTDPASNRFYARIPFTGAAPATVKLRNITDNPASTSSVAVTTRDITITQASFDGTKLTVAATSKGGGGLTVTGVGPLPSGAATDFPMTAPPAVVTVTQGTAKATQEVLVTGGAATTPLPTVPPSGTVDPTPGGDTSTSTGGTVTPGTGTTPAGEPKAAVAAAQVGLLRGATATLDASGSTNAKTFAWTTKSGPDVTITAADTAKPTVTLPFQVKTTDTQPATLDNGPTVLTVTVTGDPGTTPATAEVTITPQVDTLATTTARHRLGTELRIDGTSLFAGAAKILTPQTQVVIYDRTPGHAMAKLGTSPVDTLGGWSLKPKPGPAQQVTSVLVQSSRGGTTTATVATK
jgi:hypothetical protein